MRSWRQALTLTILLSVSSTAAGQELYSRETEFLKLIYYDKNHEYLTYHLERSFENSLAFHRKLFDYTPSEPILILMQDFGDYGHGGTSTVPWNYMSIGIEPFDYVYDTMPANERMNWLMHHELVHVVATDKGADRDLFFRRMFRGKVPPIKENPMSMYYSYLTSPRWYSPRWYHEGIAVFLETWMAGGIGRVLGGYDEMVFRTKALEDSYFYDVVGLESEGTTIDFQVGQNSYLYGTRFVTYLADQYGPDKLIEWFDRRPGSEPYFSSQFKKVYGTSLDEEWGRWIKWEHEWQKKNLDLIRQYPTTIGKQIYPRTLGSVSRSYFDPKNRRLFAAINYPATTAHIVAIDLESGKSETLTEVSGSALYYVSSLAYSPKQGKIFFTTDNSRGWRDINEVDIETHHTRQLLKDARTGDLVVNPADESIWGVQHHNGFSSLVRIALPYEGWTTILTLDYGRDIYDLDISPDGKTLSASLIEINGKQKLISMNVDDLMAGTSDYEDLWEFENNAPSNFVFSQDGRYLYGTSYYTGVSNIFRYDFEKKSIEAMSNAESGLFRPLPINDREIITYRFTGEGFVPMIVKNEVHEDVSAIRYLGQDVVERHPEVKGWNAGSPARVNLDEVTTYVGRYDAGGRVKLTSVYPIVEGYKDSAAYGLRLNFADPLGLHSLNVTAAYSPDSDLSNDEEFHLKAAWDHAPWKVRLRYNPTDFYDLFGPTKVGRKGYSAAVGYGNYLVYERPKTMEYSLNLSYWGGLDTLPDFQNVAASFDEYYSASASLDFSNLKRTIGAIEPEKGVSWSLGAQANYVDTKFLPRVHGTLDFGFILPIDHSSLWIRTAAGKSFEGDPNEPFANFFFGGFGNNWVDYQSVWRYREFYAFPGIEINEVGGKDFARATLEWTLPPIRFRRLGVPGLYANWARLALFGSGLVTNVNDDALERKLTSLGAQLDVSIVLFSNLDSTLSVGYAQAREGGDSTDEFMVSLNLLR